MSTTVVLKRFSAWSFSDACCAVRQCLNIGYQKLIVCGKVFVLAKYFHVKEL